MLNVLNVQLSIVFSSAECWTLECWVLKLSWNSAFSTFIGWTQGLRVLNYWAEIQLSGSASMFSTFSKSFSRFSNHVQHLQQIIQQVQHSCSAPSALWFAHSACTFSNSANAAELNFSAELIQLCSTSRATRCCCSEWLASWTCFTKANKGCLKIHIALWRDKLLLERITFTLFLKLFCCIFLSLCLDVVQRTDCFTVSDWLHFRAHVGLHCTLFSR